MTPLFTRSLLANRYWSCAQLGAGGMGTVHLGVALQPLGISRLVAIKRPHSGLAEQRDFRAEFADEARMVARVRHPNVVTLVDIITDGPDLAIVMEYLPGAPLDAVIRCLVASTTRMPLPVASAIVCDSLRGLHAAHEATGPDGEPLLLVHRDISPGNLLVGRDGLTRVLDFGVAKALGREQSTTGDELKGKLSYMAPERLRGLPATRQSDLFAMGVVLWESLAGRRLFAGGSSAAVVGQLLLGTNATPKLAAERKDSAERNALDALDEIIASALDPDPRRRHGSALEMALDIARAVPCASPAEVADWLVLTAPAELARRDQLAAEAERAVHLARFGADTAPESRPVELPVNAASAVDRVGSWRRSLAFGSGALGLAALAVSVVLGTWKNEPPTQPRIPNTAGGEVRPVEYLGGDTLLPNRRPVPTARGRSEARRSNASCDPPYSIVDGLWIYKKSCLR